MKKIYCDFCKKEINKEYQFVDWSQHRVDLDLCKGCYLKLIKTISKLKKDER